MFCTRLIIKHGSQYSCYFQKYDEFYMICYHGINKIYVLVITLAIKPHNSVNYTVKWYTLDLKVNMLPTVLKFFNKFHFCYLKYVSCTQYDYVVNWQWGDYY